MEYTDFYNVAVYGLVEIYRRFVLVPWIWKQKKYTKRQ